MNFIIVCPARSGSTMLRKLLNKHPQICCHGEVFGQNRVLGYSQHTGIKLTPDEALKIREQDYVGFVEQYVFQGPRQACGFKLLYPQLFSFQFVPVLNKFLGNTELRVVHLWRRNLLARYISEVRFRVETARNANGRCAGPAWRWVRFRVEIARNANRTLPANFVANAMKTEEVRRVSEINIAARECAHKLFASHPSVNICYEDFLQSDGEERKRLCEFLEVDYDLLPALPPKKEKSSGAGADKYEQEFSLNPVGEIEKYADYK